MLHMAERQPSSVQSRAQVVLQNSPILGLRRLIVEEHDGVLKITGRVTSFYHKQLAQEVVRAIAGSVEVINLVCVEYDESGPHDADG